MQEAGFRDQIRSRWEPVLDPENMSGSLGTQPACGHEGTVWASVGDRVGWSRERRQQSLLALTLAGSECSSQLDPDSAPGSAFPLSNLSKIPAKPLGQNPPPIPDQVLLPLYPHVSSDSICSQQGSCYSLHLSPQVHTLSANPKAPLLHPSFCKSC